MTRNQAYEKRQTEKGLKKVTLWVPENVEADLRILVDELIKNRDLVPVANRSVKTGRLKYC